MVLCDVTLPTERVSWNHCLIFCNPPPLGHAPHGACELKLYDKPNLPFSSPSRSPRSVWVEMDWRNNQEEMQVTLPTERVSWNCEYAGLITNSPCHAPHGACELKFYIAFLQCGKYGHAPHGACELKLIPITSIAICDKSRSPRSVWVEIVCVIISVKRITSRSPRSVWVEITCFLEGVMIQCHAPHGACELKLFLYPKLRKEWFVTLPTERVSWNQS